MFPYLYLQNNDELLGAKEHVNDLDDVRPHLVPHMFCTSIIKTYNPKERFTLDGKYRVFGDEKTHSLAGNLLCGLMTNFETKFFYDSLCILGHKKDVIMTFTITGTYA